MPRNRKKIDGPGHAKCSIFGILWTMLMIPFVVVSDAIATTASVVLFIVALIVGLFPVLAAIYFSAHGFVVVLAALAAPLAVYVVFRTRLGRASIELTDL